MQLQRFKPSFFLFFFLTVSCSSPSLLGTWKMVKFEVQRPNFGMATKMRGSSFREKLVQIKSSLSSRRGVVHGIEKVSDAALYFEYKDY